MPEQSDKNDPERGRRLRDTRERLGLTREQVRAAVGVSVESIRRWEKGGDIRWSNLVRLTGYYTRVAGEPIDPEWVQTGRVPAPATRRPSDPTEALDLLAQRVERLEQSVLTRLDEALDEVGSSLGDLATAVSALLADTGAPQPDAEGDTTPAEPPPIDRRTAGG